MGIVIGASRGLGRACADALAAEGVHVAMVARGEAGLRQAADDLTRRHGVRTLPVACDTAQEEACRALVQRVAAEFGRIDILVTNCGGPTPGSFDRLDDGAYERGFRSVLMSVVRLIRLVTPHMQARKWGRIINITSVSARQPIDGLLISNVFRPAVVGLAKTLSVELAPHNILVNNVCPGVHRTDRLNELVGARAAEGGTDEAEVIRRMTAAIPLGRLGMPEELGALVAFLASERAGFITGASIACDGGASRGLL